MIRHVLAGDLEVALARRQAEFSVGSDAEEWVLPSGQHTISASLHLGLPGRELSIAGALGTRLHLKTGTLFVRGERVVLSHLDITAAAAHLGSGNGAGLSVEATRAEVVSVGCRVTADLATGIRVVADEEAIVSDCRVTDVIGTGSATGMLFVARALTVTSLEARSLAGAACNGIVLISPGDEAVLALDVTVAALTSQTGLCAGFSLRAGGSIRVRGGSVSMLRGAFAHAISLLGNGRLEAASLRVEDVVGTAGGAVGLRVVSTEPRSAVEVRDVFVEGLGGTAPRMDARPHEDVTSWASETTRRLVTESALSALLPTFPTGEAAAEVVGIHVAALALARDGSWRNPPQSVRAEDLVVHRVAGTALQLETGLRAAELRRIELWMNARAGWLQAENLLLSELTVHAHAAPLRLGPGDLRFFNSVLSGGAATPVFDAEVDIEELAAVFVADGTPPWQNLVGLPYLDPGSLQLADIVDGVVPPAAPVDLSIIDNELHSAAVVVDGDLGQMFVGARAPDVALPCGLDDPEQRAWRPAPPTWSEDPRVDYRARDAASLLRVMLERARSTMVPWVAGDPSDLIQMLFELLAERLDHLSYEQERAVAEGFIETARLRRSVEDFARPLDYRVDPGLSATAMLRFSVDRDALQRVVQSASGAGLGLQAALEAGRPIEIPASSLVGNQQPEERSVVFATQEPCLYLPELESIELAEPIRIGAHRARLRGRFERLSRNRWLVVSRGKALPGLVVRVTDVHLETDTTLVTWDPRRASAHVYGSDGPAEERAVVHGNVVPAHHGLPVDGRIEGGPQASALDQALSRWRSLMRLLVDGRESREIPLPLRPSIQALGYPFLDECRIGQRALKVSVEGDSWTEIDDLSQAGSADEVYVVRAGTRGLPVLRFGDGINGAALPGRNVVIDLEMTVGSGALGNVGAQTLNQLIRFGASGSARTEPERLLLDSAQPEREDLVASIWKVTNPLPAVGGRDPEDLESIRYRAPLGVRDALSAVTPRDYERLLLRLPFVAGARARIRDAGPRGLVQLTVLLRDEDTLVEAELLRCWASVRRTLEEIRLLGFDVEVVPPLWVPLDIDLSISAAPHAVQGRVRRDVIEAISGNGGLLDPDSVGLGGDVRLSDLYEAVHAVEGVKALRVLRFRRLEPFAKEHLSDGVIPIGDHEVATVGGPRRPNSGLMTVTVCGGLS